MSKNKYLVTALIVVGALYAYRLYSRRNIKTVQQGSMIYEIDESKKSN